MFENFRMLNFSIYYIKIYTNPSWHSPYVTLLPGYVKNLINLLIQLLFTLCLGSKERCISEITILPVHVYQKDIYGNNPIYSSVHFNIT